MPTTEACKRRDRYRSEIIASTFSADQAGPSHAPTFGDYSDRYVAEYVKVPTRTPASERLNLGRRAAVPAANGATLQPAD